MNEVQKFSEISGTFFEFMSLYIWERFQVVSEWNKNEEKESLLRKEMVQYRCIKKKQRQKVREEKHKGKQVYFISLR